MGKRAVRPVTAWQRNGRKSAVFAAGILDHKIMGVIARSIREIFPEQSAVRLSRQRCSGSGSASFEAVAI
jgi:hypothetical protein